MNARKYALLGVASPLVAYVFIGVALLLSPWFSWERNALSDLGHSYRSGVAPVFNFGLLLTGLLFFCFALVSLHNHARWTSRALTVSAFSLQLVATFNETYGSLHYVVSVLFFVSIGASSLAYAAEKRSYLGVTAFVVGLASWVLYWFGFYGGGVAIPETVSTLIVMPWVMLAALKIHGGG